MPEADEQSVESQQLTVGERLRHAREAAGLTRQEIATRTKIAERHLISIDENRFLDVGGKAYAVGFSRAYARAVGLDEGEIAQAVRDTLSESEEPSQRQQPDTFEPGDPARVPGSRIAWISALGALAVIVAVYFLWSSFLSPSVSLPELTRNEGPQQETASGPAQPAPAATPAAPSEPVVFTALEPNIWIKFFDASGKQLMQKQMAEGESYTVPADADGPQVTTGRPDAFAITVGGKPVPKLNERPIIVRSAPVSAAALLSRGKPVADPTEPAVTATQAPTAEQAQRTTAIQPAPARLPAAQPAPAATTRAVSAASAGAPAAAMTATAVSAEASTVSQ